MPAYGLSGLDGSDYFAESAYLQAQEELRRIQEQARGIASDVQTTQENQGELEGQLGALAFLDIAANTPAVAGAPPAVPGNVPAQTVDAAYTQANLQATINTLVSAINALQAVATAQNTIINEQKSAINQLLAALQTAGIQA